jgi:transcriptional antiterminator RfaH
MLDDKKDWLLVRYKINEYKRFIKNLQNQNFEFYIPRIFTNTKKNIIKSQILFPGYGFVKMAGINTNALKNTLGLINIIRFGDKFAIAENTMVNKFKDLESSSKTTPIIEKQLIEGDEVSINSGPFKGYISKILSVSKNSRITVLISILGSERSLTLSRTDID